MADTTHTVEERIVFTVDVGDALRDIQAVESALNRLEQSGVSPDMIPPEAAENARQAREEVEKTTKELKTGLKPALMKAFDLLKSGEGLKILGDQGLFQGTNVIIGKLTQTLGGFWLALGAVASALGAVMNAQKGMDRENLKLKASTGQVLKGFGRLGDTRGDFDGFQKKLNDAASAAGLTSNQVRQMVSDYVDAGASLDVVSSNMSQSMLSAVDNAFLLGGGMERVGDIIQKQSKFMDLFRMDVLESDKALKGIAIDAHAAGMANERFIGTVADISAEMDLYGGHLKQTSKLLGAMSEVAGDSRAIKDTQSLVGMLKELTMEQVMFFTRSEKGLNRLSKSLSGDLTDMKERARMARDEAEKLKGTDAYAAADRRASGLEYTRDSMKRMKEAFDADQKGSSPELRYAIAQALGPIGKLKFMLGGIPGMEKEGKLDFSNWEKRLPDLARMMAGSLGISLQDAVERVRMLGQLQGKAGSLDEKLAGDPKRQKEVADLMKDQSTRAREMAVKYETFMQMITRWLSNFFDKTVVTWGDEIGAIRETADDMKNILRGVKTVVDNAYFYITKDESILGNKARLGEAARGLRANVAAIPRIGQMIPGELVRMTPERYKRDREAIELGYAKDIYEAAKLFKEGALTMQGGFIVKRSRGVDVEKNRK